MSTTEECARCACMLRHVHGAGLRFIEFAQCDTACRDVDEARMQRLLETECDPKAQWRVLRGKHGNVTVFIDEQRRAAAAGTSEGGGSGGGAAAARKREDTVLAAAAAAL